MNLSDRLKMIREKLGTSQSAMAKVADSSLPSWQGYEAGKNIPGGKVLEALARLGFNVNWILTGEGEMQIGGGSYRPLLESSESGKLTFSEKFKNIRGSLSVADFAERMHLTEKEVEELENGKLAVDIHLLSRMCIRFGINASWLVEDYGPMLKDELEKRPIRYLERQAFVQAYHVANISKKVLNETIDEKMQEDLWIRIFMEVYEQIMTGDDFPDSQEK